MANQAHSKHGWFRHKPMKYGSVKKAQLVETGHNMERKKKSVTRAKLPLLAI